MRTMACCLLMMSLIGCHSGPRWLMRDHSVSGNASYSDDLPADSTGRSEFDDSGIPPSPAQRPSDYEQSTRSKKSAGANQQAARTQRVPLVPHSWPARSPQPRQGRLLKTKR